MKRQVGMGKDNIIFVGMVALFPEVIQMFEYRDRKYEVLCDVLDNIHCSDCKHYEKKFCKGRGFHGLDEIINRCILKRVQVVSRTMIYINGRLMEIRRGRTRTDPASIVIY